MAAIGLGVIDGASVFEAVVGFAQIGEPEAARAVEHNVIRGNEGMVVACIVEPLNSARCQVNALNAPAGIIIRPVMRINATANLEP